MQDPKKSPKTAIQLLSTDISNNNVHVVLVVETWFDHKVPDDLASIDNLWSPYVIGQTIYIYGRPM